MPVPIIPSVNTVKCPINKIEIETIAIIPSNPIKLKAIKFTVKANP